MTYHIAICEDDSRDAGYVSELLHHWAQLRGCAVTEERFPSAEGFLFRYEEDRSFDRLKRRVRHRPPGSHPLSGDPQGSHWLRGGGKRRQQRRGGPHF